MAKEYPSDELRIPGPYDIDVGEARDFLNDYSALLPGERKLLAVAQGLSMLLHRQADHHPETGHLMLLPEESARRRAQYEEFLRREPIRFSAEEAN